MTNLPKLVAPARRALAAAKIGSLENPKSGGKAEVAELPGIGPNARASRAAALTAATLSHR